ncbi:hypothetical protein GCM10007275_12460 [Jeotgalicoccus coquinae]|uniref:DUF2938 domain-containing protein n=1 Tax=Jeotgalicoccus coquinae TaxID=709509 RepID=A0A6V7RN05_9STAP|nr:hypothetical protein [Jeotgalicoccus coquinae]MBB6422089.1 hypothetical protein [Jeotgalicoccus coquinae]GGE18869.1 hypothetical protein GCM10007275_12460 [Jeotgalicoccus coquinae]CAD2079802.1 hypothetical protein JEOCOQ751_01566 [Jeotgalicoccus coquinae]
MITLIKLIITGFISGAILAATGKTIRLVTGNKAEILLYNMDYMPVFKRWSDKWITGIIFHYMTCIVSAAALFYMLIPFGWELNIWPYILVYTAGSAGLYFLSMLTDKPPASNSFSSWFYWTFSHAIFGFAVGALIKWWV